MAEARAVDGLLSTVKNVGLQVDDYGLHLSVRLSIPRPKVAAYIVKAKLKALRVALFNLFFPIGGIAMILQATLLIFTVQYAERDSWLRNGKIANLAWEISEAIPVWSGIEMGLFTRIAVVTFWVSVTVSIMVAGASRVLLKLLLGWHSPMYTPPKEVGVLVKLWGAAVKLLRGGFAPEWLLSPPHLYGYTKVMPTLPLPPLDGTVKKYLRSIRPLFTDEDFAEKEKMAAEFLNNEGPRLQRSLRLKWLISTNYVTDWWEKYAYLRGRSSIMINSNYYVMDSWAEPPTKVREARAAATVWAILEYRHKQDNLELEPAVVRELWPLCMEQHRRMFNTVRIPGRECDSIRHFESDEQHTHIVVMCKGFYYRLDCYDSSIPSRRSLLPPHELERRLQLIVDDAEHAQHTTEADSHIAALTAEERTEWAKIREECMYDGINRVSLSVIETAAFMLTLDDVAPASVSDRASALLGGNGSNRWFDKSFNLVAFTDGHIGANTEHSWADALVIGHLWELTVMVGKCDRAHSYDANGHCVRTGREVPAKKYLPKKLKWDIPRGGQLRAAVAAAREKNIKSIDDVELRVVRFADFGKGKVKKMRMSPDSFVQMAMQLAFYRDQDRFGLTYEAAMTRLFRNGRTETVRSLSEDSAAFVKAMESGEPDEAIWAALLKAAAGHGIKNKDAMTGKGIDRHLFGLYVVSAGYSIDSPFLKDALSQPWILSTSQQPQTQTPAYNPATDAEDAKRVSPGGGFGPVCNDGYGVSYMIVEDYFFFHISSKRSYANTQSERFAENIFQALRDIGKLSDRILESRAGTKEAAAGAKKDN